MLDARTRALAEARAQTARATLERARAARDFAASELARVQALYSEKAVSAQELESAQWRETSSAKELAAAQSSLREAEAELLDFAAADSGAARPPVEIKAQVSGSVLRVFEESSRAVSAGAPLLEIGDPRDLEVVVEVLSRDGAIIPPGARVELHQWGGPDPLQAVVRLVEPSAFTKVSALGVEEQRVNVVADILTPPDRRPGLGDAFRVEARIVTAEAPDALKISSGALFRAQGGWAAFLLQNGRAQTKPVTVGLTSGSEMQILGGLQEGDTVVLYPGDRVRDGQRVQPISLSPQP
jgi:HlyD family secretion protein